MQYLMLILLMVSFQSVKPIYSQFTWTKATKKRVAGKNKQETAWIESIQH